ncbi:putative ribosomal RNA small subunit methyltransferase A [Candidatus Gugararchaeum adminiculabundum]|nr:putative ribosomal RNA small subunit methyltransferase A [Candidatus Gugararchaeum adminiculabundum]
MLTIDDFKPSKKLGQNFLVDESVAEREAEYLDCNGKSVLEIGAGTGNLTEKILEAGAREITAIEKDARLARELRVKFVEEKKIEIEHADFLEREVGGEAGKAKKIDRIASNVPYCISSPLLFKLTEYDFDLAVLCLQKEFVEHMVAKPGNKKYSRLSVTSQTCFEMEVMELVPPYAFRPQPKVSSAIIRVKKTGKEIEKETAKVLTNIFSHKKNTIRKAVISSAVGLNLEKKQAMEVADSLEEKNERVFTLEPERALAISRKIGEKCGKIG